MDMKLNMMHKLAPLSIVLGCILPTPFLRAQNTENSGEDATLPSLFEYFHQQLDSLPKLKIDTDWGQLIRTKQEEAYQPAVMSFYKPDGNQVELDVKLRARGNARKKVCQFPPIKVKAAKQQLKALGYGPENKLKLVLPCQAGKMHEDCLLREALAYQLYELIDSIHVKTKIIALQCWQNGIEKHSFNAFLVEDKEAMTSRLNGRLLSQGKIRVTSLERWLYLKICFFQYMIANTDWSVASRHNLQFLQLPGYQRVVAVPYDFDYAGLVNTSYAIPGSTIPIEDVSQRYFQGKNVTEQEARECSQFFLSRKEQVLQYCQSMNLLRARSMDSVHQYLVDFFDLLEEEERMIKTFVNAPGGE